MIILKSLILANQCEFFYMQTIDAIIFDKNIN